MLKRSLDIIGALVGLAIMSPFMLVTALAIKLDSRGPLIYKSLRVGKGGQLFRMYKFRTMVTGADQRGALVTAGGDPRITRVGRLLRKTKLDEWPTLWNVLIGDMSLVGPRPENPRSAAQYTQAQRRVWQVRPGITSLATIKYRHEETLLAGVADLETHYFALMQDKLALELEYVDRQSFWLDLQIIWHTVRAVLHTTPA